jgi:hypothetical protein
MIIKFWDNENYEYPLIKIQDEGYKEFESILLNYKKNEEYNFDDFLELIKDKDWFFEVLYFDKEVFF